MRFKFTLVCFFVLAAATATASPQKIIFKKDTLWLRGVVDSSLMNHDLSLAESGRNSVKNLLSTYYTYAKLNDIPRLRGLMDIADDLVNRFDIQMDKIPHRYKGFSKLNRVSLGRAVNGVITLRSMLSGSDWMDLGQSGLN